MVTYNLSYFIYDPRQDTHHDDFLTISYGRAASKTHVFHSLWEHHAAITAQVDKLRRDSGRSTQAIDMGIAAEDITWRNPSSGVNYPSIKPDVNGNLSVGMIFLLMSELMRARDAQAGFTRVIPTERLRMYAWEICCRAGLPHDKSISNIVESVSANVSTLLSPEVRAARRLPMKCCPTSHVDTGNCTMAHTNGLLCASRIVELPDGSFRRTNLQAYWRVAVLQAMFGREPAVEYIRSIMAESLQGKMAAEHRDRIDIQYLFGEALTVPRQIVSLPANLDKLLYYSILAWSVRRVADRFCLSQERRIESCACVFLISGGDVFYQTFQAFLCRPSLGQWPIPCLYMDTVLGVMGHESLVSSPGMGRHGTTFNSPTTISYWIFTLRVLSHVVRMANNDAIT